MDTVEDKVVVVVLQGSKFSMTSIVKMCRGHLRKAGSKGRYRIVKHCIEAIKEWIDRVLIQCIAIPIRYLRDTDKHEYAIRKLITSHSIAQSRYIEISFEEEKYVIDIARALIRRLYLLRKTIEKVSIEKELFGIVEIFDRDALLRQNKIKYIEKASNI